MVVDDSNAQISYTLRVVPAKGGRVSQAQYDEATKQAMDAMAAAFDAAGLPLAAIEATGEVTYRARNPRGGTHTWPAS